MSGSYDRFSGRPPQPVAAPEYDPYDDPVTGVPTGPAGYPLGQPYAAPALAAGGADVNRAAPSLDDGPREMYAPSRDTDAGRKMKATAPVVPPGSVTGRSLTLVVAIMCFLACLTAGAVWMIKESADAWLKDIASEVTVQVEPKEKTEIEKSIAEVVTFLEKQPGIRSAKPLTLEASAELLEPWLGSSDALKSLPVPRLIAIEIDRVEPPDLVEINTALTRDFKGVTPR